MKRKNLVKVIFAGGKEIVDDLLFTVLSADKEHRPITINELAEILKVIAWKAVKSWIS